MNDMTVGIENLPNVFIHKILLSPENSGYQIKVILKMFDHRDDLSWYGRIEGLNVKILILEDSDEIENLNNGLSSLHDYGGDYGPSVFQRLFVLNANSFSKIEEVDKYSLYTISVTTSIPTKPENLNVYAACFYQINPPFGISIFDKFYGPMVGEKIIINNSINRASSYFYYPDTDEEYAGPVHRKPDGSFMEGSKHSTDPHKTVVKVDEENFKIIYSEFDATGSSNGDLSVPDNPGGPQTGISTTQTLVAPSGVPTPSVPSGGYST